MVILRIKWQYLDLLISKSLYLHVYLTGSRSNIFLTQLFERLSLPVIACVKKLIHIYVSSYSQLSQLYNGTGKIAVNLGFFGVKWQIYTRISTEYRFNLTYVSMSKLLEYLCFSIKWLKWYFLFNIITINNFGIRSIEDLWRFSECMLV